ncbi:hypothetical protein CCR75_009480 [Bremia lactucae]|uniref:RxLR effector protein n=1 Tax=Bremia lactucae TaxID=4779 RepID=A0A976FMG5_BRELC|nr:hypothetical protein CCR75_009480 [Bremia lactucae]
MRVCHFALLAAAISITITLASTADELTTHNEGTNFVTRLRMPSDKVIAHDDEERVLSRVKGFLQKMGLAKKPSHSLKNANVALSNQNDFVATKTFQNWVDSNSAYILPTTPSLMGELKLSDIGMAKALTTVKSSNELEQDLLFAVQMGFIREIVKKETPNDEVVKLLRKHFGQIYDEALKAHQKSKSSAFNTNLVTKDNLTF